jgi:hypothetical protein
MFLFLNYHNDIDGVFASVKEAPGGKLPVKISLILCFLKIEWKDVFIFVV